MRLTFCTNRWTRAAVLAAWAALLRLPEASLHRPIQAGPPRQPGDESRWRTRRSSRPSSSSSSLPMPMPKVAKPRTTNDPEAQEIWQMTLQEAIRIGLDNSEVVRVIAFGAQGIPIGGFEPTPLNTGAGAGVASSLGAGTLQTVYDPAIQETQIATALSNFDTASPPACSGATASQPFNNGVAGRLAQPRRHPVPDHLSTTRPRSRSACQKRTATGALLGDRRTTSTICTQNSSSYVTPSAYTTNLQLTLTQPLLGSAPLPAARPPARRSASRPTGRRSSSPGSTPTPPSGGSRPRSWPRSGRSSSSTGASPSSTSSSGAPSGPSSWPRRSSTASRPSCEVGRGTVADVAEAAAAARAVQARPGDQDLRRDHDRAAAPQPPRPAAGRQPPDHPGHRRRPRPGSSPTGTRAWPRCSPSSPTSSSSRSSSASPSSSS